MNWEAIGAIGEVIGGVAVIVSLLYLAIQIRQNSRMLKATALSATTEAYLSFNMLLGSDPEAARVFQVGLEDFASLTEAEQRQFLNLLRACFVSYQHVYHQYENGLLDDEMWEQFLRASTHLLAIPHIAVWWEDRKSAYTPQFVQSLERAPQSAAPRLAAEVIAAMLKATEPPRP